MQDSITERHYYSLSVWKRTATTSWIIVFGGMRGMRAFATLVNDTAFIEISEYAYIACPNTVYNYM